MKYSIDLLSNKLSRGNSIYNILYNKLIAIKEYLKSVLKKK